MGAGAWESALQLCNSAVVAQVSAGNAVAGWAVSCAAIRKPQLGRHQHVAFAIHHSWACPPPHLLTHPPPPQGSSCAPVFNFVLRKAAEARQFDAVVALLSAMRAANVEVDSGVAALVRAAGLVAVRVVVAALVRAARLAGCQDGRP